MTESPDPELLSVIVPAYNEEEGIREFNRSLLTALRSLPFPPRSSMLMMGVKTARWRSCAPYRLNMATSRWSISAAISESKLR